jgi:hypothetical protein
MLPPLLLPAPPALALTVAAPLNLIWPPPGAPTVLIITEPPAPAVPEAVSDTPAAKTTPPLPPDPEPVLAMLIEPPVPPLAFMFPFIATVPLLKKFDIETVPPVPVPDSLTSMFAFTVRVDVLPDGKVPRNWILPPLPFPLVDFADNPVPAPMVKA